MWLVQAIWAWRLQLFKAQSEGNPKINLWLIQCWIRVVSGTSPPPKKKISLLAWNSRWQLLHYCNIYTAQTELELCCCSCLIIWLNKCHGLQIGARWENWFPASLFWAFYVESWLVDWRDWELVFFVFFPGETLNSCLRMGQMDQQYLGLVGAYDGTVMHVFLNIFLYSKDFVSCSVRWVAAAEGWSQKEMAQVQAPRFLVWDIWTGRCLVTVDGSDIRLYNQLMWRIYRIIYRVF